MVEYQQLRVRDAYLEGIGADRKVHAAGRVWHAALPILREGAGLRFYETLSTHSALFTDVVGFLLALGDESKATLAAGARGA